jgi:hypothetical protein
MSEFPHPTGFNGGVTLTDRDVEKLAKVEHRRWMNERMATGWRHSPVRDNDRKLHPDLVEWGYLSEESHGKDRPAVRNSSAPCCCGPPDHSNEVIADASQRPYDLPTADPPYHRLNRSA